MNHPGNCVKTIPGNSSLGTSLVLRIRKRTTHQQCSERKIRLRFRLTLRSPQTHRHNHLLFAAPAVSYSNLFFPSCATSGRAAARLSLPHPASATRLPTRPPRYERSVRPLPYTFAPIHPVPYYALILALFPPLLCPPSVHIGFRTSIYDG